MKQALEASLAGMHGSENLSVEDQQMALALEASLAQSRQDFAAFEDGRAAAREIEAAKGIQRDRIETLQQELEKMKPAAVLDNAAAPSSMFNMIAKGDVAALGTLLDQEPELVNSKVKLGWGPYSIGYGVLRYGHTALFSHWCTPLHLAVYENQLDAIRVLVERGADPEALDGWGHSVRVSLSKSLAATGAEELVNLRSEQAERCKASIEDAKQELGRLKRVVAYEKEQERRAERQKRLEELKRKQQKDDEQEAQRQEV